MKLTAAQLVPMCCVLYIEVMFLCFETEIFILCWKKFIYVILKMCKLFSNCLIFISIFHRVFLPNSIIFEFQTEKSSTINSVKLYATIKRCHFQYTTTCSNCQTDINIATKSFIHVAAFFTSRFPIYKFFPILIDFYTKHKY